MSVSDWPEIVYFVKQISNIFLLVDRGHDLRQTWNLEQPSIPTLSAYNILRIYSKVEDYETENKTRIDTGIWVRENGGSQDFNFIYLITKSHVRRELALLQFILWKQCCVRCSDLFKLFVNGKFTKRFHFLGARIDLFIIFVCSLYSLWATVRLLHHFGFVCALILGYVVWIFHAIELMQNT